MIRRRGVKESTNVYGGPYEWSTCKEIGSCCTERLNIIVLTTEFIHLAVAFFRLPLCNTTQRTCPSFTLSFLWPRRTLVSLISATIQETSSTDAQSILCCSPSGRERVSFRTLSKYPFSSKYEHRYPKILPINSTFARRFMHVPCQILIVFHGILEELEDCTLSKA